MAEFQRKKEQRERENERKRAYKDKSDEEFYEKLDRCSSFQGHSKRKEMRNVLYSVKR